MGRVRAVELHQPLLNRHTIEDRRIKKGSDGFNRPTPDLDGAVNWDRSTSLCLQYFTVSWIATVRGLSTVDS